MARYLHTRFKLNYCSLGRTLENTDSGSNPAENRDTDTQTLTEPDTPSRHIRQQRKNTHQYTGPARGAYTGRGAWRRNAQSLTQRKASLRAEQTHAPARYTTHGARVTHTHGRKVRLPGSRAWAGCASPQAPGAGPGGTWLHPRAQETRPDTSAHGPLSLA